MSTAGFADGHTEEMRNASLRQVFDRATDQLDRGAEYVKVFREPEPHDFAGTFRRCTTCGQERDGVIHTLVDTIRKQVADLAKQMQQ